MSVFRGDFIKKLKLILFTSYPKMEKDKFIIENNDKNYFRVLFLSKIMMGISLLMYMISIFENDLQIIKNFNMAFVISSFVILLLLFFGKPTSKVINKFHNSIVLIMILAILLWSSSLIAFVPGRYEMFGTYSLIIISIASVVYLRWATQLLLQLCSFA